MTRTSRFILFTAIAAMTACTDELPIQIPAAPDEYIPGLEGYDFMIATEETYSRTVYTDHFHSEFSDKDRLGAFSLQYPTTDNELDITLPATGWRDGEPNRNAIYTVHVLSNLKPGDGDNIQRLQVLAGPEGGKALKILKGGYLLYYPYDEVFNDAGFDRSATEPTTTNFANLAYSVKTDQRNDEDFEKSDLLWDVVTTENSYTGDKIDESGSNPIKVYMDHVMATIVVKVYKDSIDTDYGVRLLNLFDTAWGVDLTRNVHLADDATSADASSPTQLCDKGHQLRCRYTASDAQGSTELTNRAASINMHVESYQDPFDKDMLILRAAVPAYQTIHKDQEIIDVKLVKERDKTTGTILTTPTKYKSATEMTLLPGHNYIFSLRTGELPAIPTVSDDESWVLDVVDPDHPDKLVGLLCREYLRFQPDQTEQFAKGEETGTVATAKDLNGNPTKNVNSQAWVFYSLQDDGKTPELGEGIAMRFVYDVLYVSNKTGNSPRGISTWPLPHHKAFGIYQQIILSVAHGHRWVDAQDALGIYGTDSRDYEEYYMHGAKIIWDGMNNRIADVQLRTEGISDPNGITNSEASLYGHIAIPADGSAPYVSYSPAANDEATIDTDGCKIGKLIPRTLHDSRLSEDRTTVVTKEYPIVKIGFNQFWMSKSLRAKTLRDGTPLVSYNKVGEPGLTFGNYNDDGVGVLQPGYFYSYATIDENTVFDPANNMTSEEREARQIAALYTYSAFENELLTPLSPESNYTYNAPYVEDMDKLMHYYDYVFSAKMSTKGVWEGINNKDIPNPSESKLEALRAGDWTSSNCDLYCSNISGFNLRPRGFMSNDLTGGGGSPGDVAALLLLSRYRDELGISYASFNSWNCWSSSEFSGFYPSSTKYIIAKDAWQREQTISRVCAQVRYFMRFKNQQDAAYYGEGGTDFARTLGYSIKKSIKSKPVTPHNRRASKDVHLELKR